MRLLASRSIPHLDTSCQTVRRYWERIPDFIGVRPGKDVPTMAEKGYSTSNIMELLPWPYSFVAFVNGDDEGPRPVDYLLTQDHLDGIDFLSIRSPEKTGRLSWHIIVMG